MSAENSGENSGKRGRIENLNPWKKGHSGNPGGRPKRDYANDLAVMIMSIAAEPQNAEAIACAMVKKFRKGDARAFEIIAARGFGKPIQQVDVSEQKTVTVIIDL